MQYQIDVELHNAQKTHTDIPCSNWYSDPFLIDTLWPSSDWYSYPVIPLPGCHQAPRWYGGWQRGGV